MGFDLKPGKSILTPRTLVVLFLFPVVGFIAFFSLNPAKKKREYYFFLNHHDTVDYVGMSTCASCHEDKVKSFLRTGMGRSFHQALPQESSADFSRTHVVYDTINDLYYTPFWRGNDLFIREFRLDGQDTIHQKTVRIQYIIGSGQHTNSHLILENGFIYQAPLTWYSQEKRWGLPPGFEKGNNTRFGRIINEECMSCHNAMPVMDKASDFRFLKVGNGIDCERCHGPGELHVNLRLKGKTIKSKQGIDRTIVNPSKLSWQQQVDLCQRCHLQGNAVLRDKKSFTDFRPGMKLSDFMDVYMPSYQGGESEIIMASHAQRLQMSQCFIKSNKGSQTNLKLTCINCHNPHISVRETNRMQFNNACGKCHGKEACKAPEGSLRSEQYNCVGCHMPSSGTSDIPHVTVHDHNIRKPALKKGVTNGRLLGLYCINNEEPSAESRIKAYLTYYEKFDQKAFYLEKAWQLLRQGNFPVLEVHYWYLKGNDRKVIACGKRVKAGKADAWTHYRIGQACLRSGANEMAAEHIRKAIELQPLAFEFILKLSKVMHEQGNTLEEEALLKQVIKLNPNHTQALNDLGFLYYKSGDLPKALAYYNRSLKSDPDFLPVLKNLFDYYIQTNNSSQAARTGKQILILEPGNQQVRSILKGLPQ